MKHAPNDWPALIPHTVPEDVQPPGPLRRFRRRPATLSLEEVMDPHRRECAVVELVPTDSPCTSEENFHTQRAARVWTISELEAGVQQKGYPASRSASLLPYAAPRPRCLLLVANHGPIAFARSDPFRTHPEG